MGRLKSKSDYEELRKDRIVENQARLASLGLQKTLSELRSLTSSLKHVRKYFKVDYSANPLRRSARLRGESSPSEGKLGYSSENGKEKGTVNGHMGIAKRGLRQWQISQELKTMGRLKAKSDYEELRKARIVENQARLASLGLQKTISELRSLTSPPKSDRTHVKKYYKVDYSANPLRRSARLRGKSPPSEEKLSYLEGSNSSENGKEKGTVNGHIVRAKRGLRQWQISQEALRRRCESKGRGSLYNPVYGICCHFCRQKKLCGEEDCKRCGDLDMDQPCIGKTDCSICHSSNGVLCRACLKVRYGEEMEEVRSDKEWICPHCIEDKGIKPYWICNSSFCLKKRKMVPTGIAIYRARQMGYKSVAHLLMDELQRADKRRS